MHHFFLPPEKCRGASLQLDGREAHHALHVLRLKRGDAAVVLDGAGGEFLCKVENAGRDFLSLAVKGKKNHPAPPCSVTLLLGIPKGKIIEDIIEKAVELGAQRIVPLLTERVVTKLNPADAEVRREKWQAVAIEAIKQCGATWLPKVEAPLTIEKFLTRKESFNLQLVGSLQTERRHAREVLRAFEKENHRLPKTVGVWIGPEGDFTLDELRAIENSGAQPISLGSLILRVETATIYCLSFLNYELRQ